MTKVVQRPIRLALGRRAAVVIQGLLSVGVLGGCSSTQDQTGLVTSALAPGKARIVLERTNETLYGAAPATAKVNGTKVADVGAGATAVVDVVPGPVSLSVEAWSYPGTYTIPLDVQAGETVKVEIAPRVSAVGVAFGAIGGFVDKDDQGNGGAFTLRQVANLDAPAGAPPAVSSATP